MRERAVASARLRLIVRHLRARTAGAQCGRALQVLLVQADGRLHIEEIGPLNRIVDLNQDLALRELLVRLELHLLDQAADLHGELDAVLGAGCADRVDAGRPFARGDLDGRHGLRRRLHGREEAGDHLIAEEIEPDEPAADPDRQDEEDSGHKAAFHELKDSGLISSSAAARPCSPAKTGRKRLTTTLINLYTVQTVQLQEGPMTSAARKRSSSRERILDAAAELVRELGAARLTLDAVAERAELSKGGLLYNFPSKDALLQAMLERIIEAAHAEKEMQLRNFEGQPNAHARASIETALRIREKIRGIDNGILAASAENPKLLDSIRDAIAEEWNELKQNSDDPDSAALAWLAIEGLGSLEMHSLSPLTAADRKTVIAAVRRLLAKA